MSKKNLKLIPQVIFVVSLILIILVIFDRPAVSYQKIPVYLCGTILTPSTTGVDPGGPCIRYGNPSYSSVIIPRPSIENKLIGLGTILGLSVISYGALIYWTEKSKAKRKNSILWCPL